MALEAEHYGVARAAEHLANRVAQFGRHRTSSNEERMVEALVEYRRATGRVV